MKKTKRDSWVPSDKLGVNEDEKLVNSKMKNFEITYRNRSCEVIHSDGAAQLDDTIIFDNQVSVIRRMSDKPFGWNFLTSLIINISYLNTKKIMEPWLEDNRNFWKFLLSLSFVYKWGFSYLYSDGWLLAVGSSVHKRRGENSTSAKMKIIAGLKRSLKFQIYFHADGWSFWRPYAVISILWESVWLNWLHFYVVIRNFT